MNKKLILLIACLMAVSAVLAAGNGSQGNNSGSDNETEFEMVCCETFGYGAMMEKVDSTYAMVSEDECIVPDDFVGGGKNVVDDDFCKGNSDDEAEIDNSGSSIRYNGSKTQLRNGSEMLNGTGLRMGQTEVKSEFRLQNNGSEMRVNLSNGRNALIKVMPETASETALARLGLKVCVPGNCSIVLKEVGKGNETAPVYEVEVETEGKFLGLFKTKAKVKTQVNAETGEIMRVKKPFLTTIPEA
jgi:predicted small secreted protein